MKFLLALLVVLNLAWYGTWHGWFGRDLQDMVVPEQREPERLSLQVAPERLTVLSDGKADPSAVTPPPATNATAVATLSCLETIPLVVDDARKLVDKLTALGPDVKVTQRPMPEAVSYIVYLAPYASRVEADRVAADLRSKGVDDLVVIQDIPALRNGISLGIFRSEETARTRLASLSARGVPRAQIQPRPAAARAVLELRDLPLANRSTVDQQARESGAGDWHDCAARKG
ncbi:SPOR domain-containing protein [soil metagenome]